MSECIEFKGARNNMGYGVVRRDGRLWLLHRWVMREAGHDVKGKVVMHLCDNPACYRLDHLRVGTHRDNTQDMVHKGRARGNSGPSSNRKLTPVQVAIARKTCAPTRVLAREFGVSPNVIRHIRQGKTYREIAA